MFYNGLLQVNFTHGISINEHNSIEYITETKQNTTNPCPCITGCIVRCRRKGVNQWFTASTKPHKSRSYTFWCPSMCVHMHKDGCNTLKVVCDPCLLVIQIQWKIRFAVSPFQVIISLQMFVLTQNHWNYRFKPMHMARQLVHRDTYKNLDNSDELVWNTSRWIFHRI